MRADSAQFVGNEVNTINFYAPKNNSMALRKLAKCRVLQAEITEWRCLQRYAGVISRFALAADAGARTCSCQGLRCV